MCRNQKKHKSACLKKFSYSTSLKLLQLLQSVMQLKGTTLCIIPGPHPCDFRRSTFQKFHLFSTYSIEKHYLKCFIVGPMIKM